MEATVREVSGGGGVEEEEKHYFVRFGDLIHHQPQILLHLPPVLYTFPEAKTAHLPQS